MASTRIKMLQEKNFKVCRFCLHSNAKELDSIYEKIGGNEVVSPTIKDVLAMLEIQIPLDALPKLICISCRDSLVSIHSFRKNAKKSMDLFEKAIETKPNDFPITTTATDAEVQNESFLERSDKDLGQDVAGDDDCAQVDDHTIDEIKEEIDDAAAMLSMTNEANDEIREDEQYLEEDYLDDDGYIPVQNDGEILVYSMKTSPKARKAPTGKVCTVCGIKTTAMSVHMRIHTNDRRFACDMCDLKFYTNGKLRCHYESVHVGERKFSCEVCGKSFVLKKNLKAHMMSHSAKREHVCSHCSKSFLFKWSLTAHERIHTGERPYACNWQNCGKRFVTVSNLIQHQKTTKHWKAPEEICPLCGKAFQTKASLKAHQTKTHGSEVPR